MCYGDGRTSEEQCLRSQKSTPFSHRTFLIILPYAHLYILQKNEYDEYKQMTLEDIYNSGQFSSL